jgi:hypothetical protein
MPISFGRLSCRHPCRTRTCRPVIGPNLLLIGRGRQTGAGPSHDPAPRALTRWFERCCSSRERPVGQQYCDIAFGQMTANAGRITTKKLGMQEAKHSNSSMSGRYFFGPHTDAQAADNVLMTDLVHRPGSQPDLMLLDRVQILPKTVAAGPPPQDRPKQPKFSRDL